MTASVRSFLGKLGFQQRILPAYRAPFFERLGAACQGGLSLFAGRPRPNEAVLTAQGLNGVRLIGAENLHLFGGSLYVCVQPGIGAWLDAWDPDALVLEANPRYPSNLRALRWMKERGRPVLGWGLGAAPSSGPLAGLTRRYRRRFFQRFDGLISYSSLGAEQYAAAGVPRERVFIAPNAVAPPPGPPPERGPLVA